jgi:mannitol/fructose-specific phosphotransferase system IIA component (Ntr-type)
VRLRDFLAPSAIDLDLPGTTRDEVFSALVHLLGLDQRSSDTVVRQMIRREAQGSTGFGGGIAIPHCRTLAVRRLMVAVGRCREGIRLESADGQPVRVFFLIVAPPLEVSNQYLPVLGRVAQLLHDPATVTSLLTLETPEDLLALLDAKGI